MCTCSFTVLRLACNDMSCKSYNCSFHVEGLLKSVEESLLHMAKQSGKADESAVRVLCHVIYETMHID